MSTVPIITQIKQARIDMLLDHPFFGGPSLRLELVDTPSLPAPMGTDGVHLFYNEDMLSKLKWSKAENIAVVCHEVLHCVNLHHLRRKSRNYLLFNISCDFAINLIIKECGLKLPGKEITKAMLGGKDETIGHLLDPQYKGWAAERIYDDLLHDKALAKRIKDASLGTSWDIGQVKDGPTGQADEQKAEWEQAARQAAQIAKARGLLPAGLASFIDELLEPRIDWKSILREFVQTCLDRVDYTWNRPNPRFVPHDLYVPRLWGERTPPFGVAIDTSGSTGSKAVRVAFASEIAGIAEETKPQKLWVFHSDAKVHKVQEFDQGAEVHIKEFVGNGGTDFRPVFDHIRSEGLDTEIACLIYLTDLEGPFPDVAPGYPVLWASVTDLEAPFGRTVKIKLEE
jgi:predicted metal-dependent peptidase